ncbi:Bug family tripartite tricarboxylate transporter substrate binding protein [Belnapia rosea]|uniref:Tripartite-type tricarboxylate transporter, receptor component TctC n=1 Tax=Belnapia rosea TaxID=938405 RepID=A0A1G6NUB1_9PROT|nr:tripartite tricarboxylate transporter substrate binding protein [Belnapia rosea]SDB65972.1 Tripartite-type tricarboxylate transporter, receptor component TctC [Belnapia rosea]SDC71368.1 Tripartite-type tricarboxylate transporter, receptor component TctC [Belnapia rosea]
MKRRHLLALALPMAAARAQSWPERPVRLVVPFAAGTTTDILGRIAGTAIAQGIGHPVVVDNRSGAGGTVGAAFVAQSAPDGYTLLFGTSGTMATNPAIMPGLPYAPLRDFAPVAAFARTSVVLGVRPQLGVATLGEFLALARRRPLSVGSAGTGTTGHLTQALLQLRSGVTTTHVPYRDGARAVTDLLNGTLDAMIYHPLGFLPHIQSGAIRPLAVTGVARHFLFPDVPTMAEAGQPGVVVEGWWAIYAPAGTPTPILARLNALTNAALAEPASLAELRRQGLEVMGGTPEALAEKTRTELAAQRELAQAANITAD